MDFQDKKVKIGIALIGGVLVALFAYLEYKPEPSLTKVSPLGKMKHIESSEDSQLAQLRKKQRNYKREVSDYSFSDYLNNQIDQDTYHPEQDTILLKGEKEIHKDGTSRAIVYKDESRPVQTSYFKQTTLSNTRDQNLQETTEPAHHMNNKKVTHSKYTTSTNRHPPLINEVSSEEVEAKTVRRVGFASNSIGEGRSVSAHNDQVSDDARMKPGLKVAILQTQKVKTGDIILLRTIESGSLNGKTIPSNTIVEGNVRLSKNRMDIIVEALQVGESTTYCDLYAYTLTGNQGLSLNNEINYEIKNDATAAIVDEMAQSVNVPYLGALTEAATRKKIADPVVELRKGTKMVLKQKS